MKIAISVPCKDTVHSGFAYCLSNLTSELTRKKIEFDLNFNYGSVIAGQRNDLVIQALETNASHILWLDSDMHFPRNIVSKFLSHNKSIVAANYSTRYKPRRSVAFVDPNNIDVRLDASKGLHKVWAIGMGCMLVDIEVYKKLYKPWYQYIWNEDTEDLSGEDIYFCNSAKEIGYDTYVDCDISNQVAHYGTKAFLINETLEFSR